MIVAKTKTELGPQHHGRKMTLKRFEFAKTEDGWMYELARGYVVVTEVPNFPHARQAAFVRKRLDHYDVENLGAIYEILTGAECKLLITSWESERHPDIAVYLTGPKGRRNRTMWLRRVPDLVVEIVSESSRDRDYTQKRDEYWTVGVKEYWIVDAKLAQVLVLKRGRTEWTEKALGPQDVSKTKLLPGFKLPCRAIFEVAETTEE